MLTIQAAGELSREVGELNFGLEADAANAARIVACVNACEGIATDALAELPKGVGGLLEACVNGIDTVRALRASNAALIAALRPFAEMPTRSETPGTARDDGEDELIFDARAAIALAQGDVK